MEKGTTNSNAALFERLMRAGMNPQCDFVEVPYYTCGVRAGIPTAPGDYDGEKMQVLCNLVKSGALFCVDARGDSMTGVGINDGDTLMVRFQNIPRDGDVVVAMLGEEATVKTYDVDETGAAWLVPANPNYRPILINDYEDCYIVGTVERVEKAAPHTSHRDTAALINQERRLRQQEGRSVDDQVLRTALHNISPRVKSARQWFAVYRAMVDAKVISDGDFMAFKGKLTEIMGEGTPCIDLREIRRLAVQSFSKPVVLWDIDNAPVQSRSFYEYQELATDFLRMLRA